MKTMFCLLFFLLFNTTLLSMIPKSSATQEEFDDALYAISSEQKIQFLNAKKKIAVDCENKEAHDTLISLAVQIVRTRSAPISE